MSQTDAKARGQKRLNGFIARMGAELTHWDSERVVIELPVEDLHLNGIGVVHGGVIGALIDTAGARAGIFCTVAGNKRSAMTVSLNVNLVGNISEGVLVTEARLRKAGKTIYVSSCDVHDGDGNLLATGEVVCRYARGSHLPEGVPETL
jgi:uncharacterized protein (TIGR00369 family)